MCDKFSLSEELNLIVPHVVKEISEAFWLEAHLPVWVLMLNFVVFIEIEGGLVVQHWENFVIIVVIKQEFNKGSLEGLHVLGGGSSKSESSSHSVS